MSTEQAFQAIVRNCLDHIEGNEAGVSRYRDPESLHQMRVGLRRLHAAFALFRKVLHVPPMFNDELDWLMGQLGPLRDWDVFIELTLPRVVAGLPGYAGLDKVRDAALEKSTLLFAQACMAVSSERFGKFIRTLDQWGDQRGWRHELSVKNSLDMRVREFANAIVAQEQQRLLKRGRKLKRADAGQRHRVRIAAKRTRYAIGFFSALYSGKRMRRYVQALSSVQKQLGWLNDAAVASRLLGEACDDSAGAALVRGYLAAFGEIGVRRLRKRWKKFKTLSVVCE
ncbi:MAG: CHAD domain-containing protein [Pseudomonadota bacterium]